MACILVVDDDFHICELLKIVLERMEHDVVVCDSAESARSTMIGLEPDLAFLDIDLPGEHGISLAKFFRDQCPLVPVAIMSGVINNRDQGELLDAGPSCLLHKPFEIASLPTLIADLLVLKEEFRVVRGKGEAPAPNHTWRGGKTFRHQKVTGHVSAVKFEQMLEKTLNDPSTTEAFNVLWDLRETTLTNLTLKQIAVLARSLRRYRVHSLGGKAAVLVGRTSDYCLVMAAKAFMSRTPRKMKIFRTFSRAREWLECEETANCSSVSRNGMN